MSGRAKLIYLDAQGNIREAELKPEGSRLGRMPDCEILSDDTRVSREHAVFVLRTAWFVENLKQHNTTLVNDQPIQAPVALRHNDIITCASMKLRFHLVAAADGATLNPVGLPATDGAAQRAEAERAKLQGALAEAEAAKAALQRDLTQAASRRAEAERDLDRAEARCRSSDKELQAMRNDNAALRVECNQYQQKAERLVHQYRLASTEVAEAREEARKESQRATATLDAERGRVRALGDEIERKEACLREAERTRDQLVAQRQALQDQLAELRRHVTQGSAAPVVGVDSEELRRARDELARRRLELERAAEEQRAVVADLRAQLDTRNAELRELRQRGTQLEEQLLHEKECLNGLRCDYRERVQEMEDARATIDRLSGQKSRLAADKESLATALREAEQKLIRLGAGATPAARQQGASAGEEETRLCERLAGTLGDLRSELSQALRSHALLGDQAQALPNAQDLQAALEKARLKAQHATTLLQTLSQALSASQ